MNRIQPFIASLISPFQCSFIPRRNTTDNVVITQEIVHFVRKKPRKKDKNHLVVKIDLHKAYDNVDRGFMVLDSVSVLFA